MRRPNRPASLAPAAACAAASSALLGTQPKFRQSPPMRSRSIRATLNPSCAAAAVTESPAAPAPMTARSKSGIDRFPAAPDNGQQGEGSEPKQRQEDTG